MSFKIWIVCSPAVENWMVCSSSRASLWKQYFKLTDHATNDWFTDSLNEWMSFIYIKWFVDKIVVYLVLHVGKKKLSIWRVQGILLQQSTTFSRESINMQVILLVYVNLHVTLPPIMAMLAAHCCCCMLLSPSPPTPTPPRCGVGGFGVNCGSLWPLAWFAVSQWKCRIVFAATPALFWNRSFPITIYTYTACTLDTTS